MSAIRYSREQLIRQVKISQEDLTEINQHRQPYTCLGFAYQLAFVRLFNRFPIQQPFEVDEEILAFMSLQLHIPADLIYVYTQRQPTISEHREQILAYLGLRRLGETELVDLKQFLFEEACRLEQTGALLAKAVSFLRAQHILQPAEDTVRRLISQQREQAKQHIYQRISEALSPDCQKNLDSLVAVDESRLSPLQVLKEVPKRAAPQAMLRLLEKLEQIGPAGAFESGKEVALPPPPPLGTARTTFTVSGSSISNAH